MVKVILPDGSSRSFDQPEVPVSEVVALLSDRLRASTVGVLFGGQLRDVYQSVTGEGTFRALRDEDEQSLYLLRHTASHVLAHAVQELFPDAKFAIGPPIDEGFYYDFEVDKPFTPEDLARIEARVHELLKENLPISREVWDKGRAREHFGRLGQRYKLELIDDIPGDSAGYRYVLFWCRPFQIPIALGELR